MMRDNDFFMFSLKDLQDNIDDLDYPVIVSVDYFEKYPLIPINIVSSIDKNLGKYYILMCKVSDDYFEGYTTLIKARKEYQYAEKLYKQSIRDYFHYEYKISVFNISLRFSDRYGDTLEFKVYGTLPFDVLLGFVKKFKYRLPSMTTQQVSTKEVYTFYKFYKLKPQLEEVLERF